MLNNFYFNYLWLYPIIIIFSWWFYENYKYFKVLSKNMHYYKEFFLIFFFMWFFFLILNFNFIILFNNNFESNFYVIFKNYTITTKNFLNNFNSVFYYNINSILLLFLSVIFFSFPISYTILDHRINKFTNFYLIYYLYLFTIIIFLFFIQNIFLFLVLYEMILIPAFLLMYNLGSSRQCIEGSMYFFLWAHFGSLFLILGISYIIIKTNNFYFFYIILFKFNNLEVFLLFWIFFIGFGCKIPLWPFYFWLPKAHVEAPTGLSVFLSGILVKIAFYGYYKFTELLSSDLPTNLASILPIMGVIDGSTKMFYQTDFKKLIALATVVHMNYIIYSSILGLTSLLKGGVYLLINHCFSATALFICADVIYRRTGTRLSYEISGLYQLSPWIFFFIFFSLLVNFNYPGTLGFLGEVYVGSSSFILWPVTTLIIHFFLFFVSVVSFTKPWLDASFGYPFIKLKTFILKDAIKKELFLIGFPVAYSFYLGFNSNNLWVLLTNTTNYLFMCV